MTIEKLCVTGLQHNIPPLWGDSGLPSALPIRGMFNSLWVIENDPSATLASPMYARILTSTIARWLVLLVSCVVSLFFLNDAFFSGWVAGGPPGPHKLGWERRAFNSLLLAGASLVGGIGAFRALGRFPQIGIASWLMIALAGSLALTPFVTREFLVDTCLDKGGSWSASFLECAL